MKQLYLILNTLLGRRSYNWQPIPVIAPRKFLTILFIAGAVVPSKGQFSPSNPAQFGIDGDVNSDVRQQGSFTAAGSHDWFQSKNGTGRGIFDTSDSTSLKNILSTGSNYAFLKRMQYPRYSVQNGLLFLDGLYARDYFGNSNGLDKTVFGTNPVTLAGNKNSQDPSTWFTVPAGDLVTAKSDIIDAYVHMRRNGTSTNPSSISHLILNLGASVLSTGGDHHIDFELFKNELTYDGLTGKFNQPGPASTGGRTTWQFNADGSVKTGGDMSISYSFDNFFVKDIAIYIWVSLNQYQTLVPKNFTFTGDWNGSTSNANYGYARIVPTSTNIYSWGSVNNVLTDAPAWGTNSKDLGSQLTSYYSTKYAIGQFAEAAIDLTEFGVDPALSMVYDKCTAAFSQVMIKSRSSSAFSSNLQDFAGPFEFLDAPSAPVNIATPANLTCVVNSVNLSTNVTDPAVTFTWSTPNGNIVSGANTGMPVVNQPGQYIVTTTLYEGCYPMSDTITVLQDLNKPVASVFYAGVLTNSNLDSVTLKGGDTAASNYMTPFGGSQGLLWNWSGPNGFTATTQDAKTNMEGSYTLIVTEKRNGCKDTADDIVLNKPLLPIVLKSFSASKRNEKIVVKWTVEENQSGDHFELQHSADGNHFSTAQTIFTSEKTGTEQYQTTANNQAESRYFRLMLVNRNHLVSYSKVIAVGEDAEAGQGLRIIENPVREQLKISFYAAAEGIHTINIYSINGIRLQQLKQTCLKGTNTILVTLNPSMRTGHYIAEIAGDKGRMMSRFVKM